METCDRCGPAVEAQVTLKSPSDRVLTYCAHHYAQYAMAHLLENWSILEDKRERLDA
jgi:hypothetical protein